MILQWWSWKGNVIDSYLLHDKLEGDLHGVLVQLNGEDMLGAVVGGTTHIESAFSEEELCRFIK
jgi:hypothetical protein